MFNMLVICMVMPKLLFSLLSARLCSFNSVSRFCFSWHFADTPRRSSFLASFFSLSQSPGAGPLTSAAAGLPPTPPLPPQSLSLSQSQQSQQSQPPQQHSHSLSQSLSLSLATLASLAIGTPAPAKINTADVNPSHSSGTTDSPAKKHTAALTHNNNSSSNNNSNTNANPLGGPSGRYVANSVYGVGQSPMLPVTTLHVPPTANPNAPAHTGAAAGAGTGANNTQNSSNSHSEGDKAFGAGNNGNGNGAGNLTFNSVNNSPLIMTKTMSDATGSSNNNSSEDDISALSQQQRQQQLFLLQRQQQQRLLQQQYTREREQKQHGAAGAISSPNTYLDDVSTPFPTPADACQVRALPHSASAASAAVNGTNTAANANANSFHGNNAGNNTVAVGGNGSVGQGGGRSRAASEASPGGFFGRSLSMFSALAPTTVLPTAGVGARSGAYNNNNNNGASVAAVIAGELGGASTMNDGNEHAAVGGDAMNKTASNVYAPEHSGGALSESLASGSLHGGDDDCHGDVSAHGHFAAASATAAAAHGHQSLTPQQHYSRCIGAGDLRGAGTYTGGGGADNGAIPHSSSNNSAYNAQSQQQQKQQHLLLAAAIGASPVNVSAANSAGNSNNGGNGNGNGSGNGTSSGFRTSRSHSMSDCDTTPTGNSLMMGKPGYLHGLSADREHDSQMQNLLQTLGGSQTPVYKPLSTPAAAGAAANATGNGTSNGKTAAALPPFTLGSNAADSGAVGADGKVAVGTGSWVGDDSKWTRQ